VKEVKIPKIIIFGLFAVLLFTGFFTVFAAAEGTSFDDAKEISEGTFSGTVNTSYYYKVNVPAYKAILVTLEAGTDSEVYLIMYSESKQEVASAWVSNGEADRVFYDGKSTTDYLIYLKIKNEKFIIPSEYTIKVEFRPSDVMSGAELINDGQTISDTLKASGEVHWYKVNVPAYKAILVTLEAGTNSDVYLTMYSESKQQVGLGAWASNGEADKEFYDGKSTTDYLIYLKISNEKIGTSEYTIKVESRPSDVMSGAELINDGQKISNTLKASLEVHWYKINVPKGEILNVSFSSSGGEIMVTLYDEKGEAIDLNEGTSGYVDTKLLGQSGTIYIKVTSFEFQNQDVSYTITPKLVKGSSEVEEAATGFSMMYIGGVLVVIIVIVLIVYLIVRKKKGSS